MALYTMVLEFGGGTYVAEVRSSSVLTAVSECAFTMIADDDWNNVRDRQSLAVQLSSETPILISGVQNVWCCSTAVGSKIAILNVIEVTNN